MSHIIDLSALQVQLHSVTLFWQNFHSSYQVDQLFFSVLPYFFYSFTNKLVHFTPHVISATKKSANFLL